MKRYLIQGVILGCLLGLAIPAWSYTINAGATDVGSLDTLLASTTLASSADATELAWAQSIIGGSVVLTSKYDTTGSEWSATDTSGIWAHTLDFNPDYFLIKTGNVATPDVRDFLFANNADLGYAVISLIAMDFDSITNVSGISHIDEFNGTSVPEAGALLTFASGLIGLVGYRRMRRMQ